MAEKARLPEQDRARAMRLSDHIPMPSFDTTTLEILSHDWDAREVRLREIVQERLAICPPPRIDDAVVASYFFVFRSMRLEDAVAEIAYHATSGIKHPRRLTAGSVYGQGGGRRRIRFQRPHRPLARRFPAQNAAPARRAPHLGRSPAHDRRSDHLRRLREPGRPFGRPPNPRESRTGVSRAGLRPLGAP